MGISLDFLANLSLVALWVLDLLFLINMPFIAIIVHAVLLTATQRFHLVLMDRRWHRSFWLLALGR